MEIVKTYTFNANYLSTQRNQKVLVQLISFTEQAKEGLFNYGRATFLNDICLFECMDKKVGYYETLAQ